MNKESIMESQRYVTLNHIKDKCCLFLLHRIESITPWDKSDRLSIEYIEELKQVKKLIEMADSIEEIKDHVRNSGFSFKRVEEFSE